MHKNFCIFSIASLSLIGLGCNPASPERSELVVPTPEAIAPSPLQQPSPTSSKLSQFQNYCQDNETAFVFAETQEYWLNICGEFTPAFLVAVNKAETTPTRLPVTDYDVAGKWFEARNIEREYTIGFQGQFEGDIFFAIAQLKLDSFKKLKYVRELTQQPLIQLQANLIPPPSTTTAIASASALPLTKSLTSLGGIYQNNEYTLTIEELGSTISYLGCPAEKQCIFIPQVSNRERDRLIWQQDNLSYVFFLVAEGDRYRLQITNIEGKVLSNFLLQAIANTSSDNF